VIAKAQTVVTPFPSVTSDLLLIPQPISRFHRVWPVAGLAVGLMTTVAWTALLGYGLFRLVF
jgi:hypothetical protein